MSIDDYIKRYLEGRGFDLQIVDNSQSYCMFNLYDSKDINNRTRISHGIIKKEGNGIPYKDIYLYILKCSNPFQIFNAETKENRLMEFMPLYPMEKFMIYTDLLNSQTII